MSNTVSFTLDQESFALKTSSNTHVQGIIQIESVSSCFIRPIWVQIQLIGKEYIGNQNQIIINDTYHLSSKPDDWRPSFLLESAVDRIENVYTFPFSLSVSSNMPSSFQVYEDNGIICGITYILQVKISSIDQTITGPIHFHRLSTNSLTHIDNVIDKQEEEEGDYTMPKRVFWGITKQAKERWQYELEFPNTFDLVTSTSGSISVRLRSVSGHKRERRDDCCLIGCQIIQSIHLEGYQSHTEIIATTTKLLKNPNKTWDQPCHINFDLENQPLPTVINKRLGVEHYIRITVEFCGAIGECSVDLQFPVMFTGYSSLFSHQKHAVVTNMTRQTSSISSSSSLDEISSHGSTIDLPLTYIKSTTYNYSQLYEEPLNI